MGSGYVACKPADIPTGTFSRVSRIKNAAGTLLDITYIGSLSTDRAATSNDGDKFQYEIICTGAELKCDIFYLKDTDCGIFDVYINGILDTAGIDCYAGCCPLTQQTIVLTQKPKPGLNNIELRVNGKNGSSSGYTFYCYGVRIR